MEPLEKLEQDCPAEPVHVSKENNSTVVFKEQVEMQWKLGNSIDYTITYLKDSMAYELSSPTEQLRGQHNLKREYAITNQRKTNNHVQQ